MAFKMKGSPMKRNFGIGNSKTSPNKHGDLDPKLKDNIGNQHTGKKGHSHPHKGMSGSHTGTWNSADKFVSDEKSKRGEKDKRWEDLTDQVKKTLYEQRPGKRKFKKDPKDLDKNMPWR